MEGPTRAAAVLLSLDEATAAEVLKRLGPDEIKRLATKAGALRPAGEGALESALLEFEQLMLNPLQAALRRPADHIRGLAQKALGADAAAKLLEEERIVRPIDRLKTARAETLAALLEEEHPQVASAVLLQLPPERAAAILGAMPEQAQVEVLRRIGTIDQIPAAIVSQVSEALASALSDDSVGEDKSSAVDGVAFAAAMLNSLKSDEKNRLLEEMDQQSAEFAQKIREKMFTFEDLIKIAPAGLQVLMREIPSDRMLVALKTASSELRDKLLSVLAKRARDTILEDLALLPPMRVSDIETAQREITEIALRLADQGRLVLPMGSDEELV
jgi:flagellar motor switch protein FliG